MNTVQVERVNYLGKTIRQDKLAIAAVEIEVNEITKVLLNCLAAPDIENKYPEHGIINGWDQNNKEFRLEKMIELAANFKKIINIS